MATRGPFGHNLHLGLAALAAVAVAGAHAQSVGMRPEVEATLTITDNAAYATSQEAQADAILSVNPRLAILTRGARASLEGTLGIEAILYANTADATTVRPRARLDARSELVERWVFVDASAVTDRVSANPYAPRPESATAFNDYTSMRYRVRPYAQRQLTPLLSFLASTDHVVTRRIGNTSAFDPGGTDPARDAHEQAQLVRLEQRPAPFGWITEFTRQDTRHRGASTSILRQTAARAVATFAPVPQLTLGASVGREVAEYSLIDRTDSIVGGRIEWSPTERTTLDARVEKRFFGLGVDAGLRHRSPFFGVDLRVDRQAIAQSGSHLLGFAGADVADLLGDILTTRFPDEQQRNLMVDQLIRDLNLPTTLLVPVDLYTSYAQRQDNASATVLLFGRLTTVSGTAFFRRRVRLVDIEDILAPVALSSDNRQLGLDLGLTRRLSPILNVDAGIQTSKIEGLEARAGQSTRETVVRAGFTMLASPATRFGAGLRYQTVDSTVTTPSREVALVLTLLHRF